MTRHIRLTGTSRADRTAWASQEIGSALVARCHRRLRGPYTGVDTVLSVLLPGASQRWPELVEQHRFEILYGLPELVELIGQAPATLASQSPFRERTRFFGSDMVRCMSQGIVTFLVEHARKMAAGGTPLGPVIFEEAHEAEPTTQELIALLLRRCDPDLLRVVVSGADEPLLAELEEELAQHADRIACPPRPQSDRQDRPDQARWPDDLLTAYIAGHGTSDDPAEIESYQQADPALRARLHDEQATALEAAAGPSLRAAPSLLAGAISYHREHGSDPAGLGAATLAEAQQYCVEVGFSHAVVDLGLRGRRITDPDQDTKRFCDLTLQAAAALVPLGRLEESTDLYLELRRRFTLPKLHMTTSYAMAMMHTRFLEPRDHEVAMRWQNNAAAIASILPEARDRLIFGVFQDNALALIEMHRGNLHHALGLVEGGIARLDDALGDEEWVLHRSQLLYNRARLKAALGDSAGAYGDFSVLIEMDPYYTDYLCERAKISRKAGDFEGALADYDRAVRLAPPFPELYYNRATARLEVGDADGALADFGFVLEMEPRDIDSRLSRAELLLAAGELDAALADIVAGLELAPADPRLLCMRGTIHLEQGENEAALEVLTAALAADPAYPAALLNRAVAHYESGHGQQSADDLTALLTLTGDDPDVLLNRGIAYQQTGCTDLALADFDHALELPGADTDELGRLREQCLEPRAVAAAR
jgi:tetratricopeptide (TPR) repeat protein